jgi:hypothetical protein
MWKKARVARRRESENIQSCQKAVGKVQSAGEKSSGLDSAGRTIPKRCHLDNNPYLVLGFFTKMKNLRSHAIHQYGFCLNKWNLNHASNHDAFPEFCNQVAAKHWHIVQAVGFLQKIMVR